MNYMTTSIIFLLVRCSYGSNVDMNNIRAAEKFQEEAGQIYTTIFHKYNIRVRPTDTYPNPVVVDVRVILWHIRNFDRLKQEIETLLELDIQWRDNRLAWYANKVNKITAEPERVWRPSIVYVNAVTSPRLLFLSKVTISSEGIISWNRHEVVTTLCRIRFEHGLQRCDLWLGFTSLDGVENFSNHTSFTVHQKFTNNFWDVEGTQTVTTNNSSESCFTLFLKRSHSDCHGSKKNCSNLWQYSDSANFASSMSVHIKNYDIRYLHADVCWWIMSIMVILRS